jgi:arginyl-tRNA synthetase
MKTRGDGEFVELNDFLDEATDRALQAYHSAVSKRPEGIDEKSVSEAVGLSAIVFGTLNRQRLRDVQFSWDTALAFSGESGPYILYSIARLNSVIEKATSLGININEPFSPTESNKTEAYQLAAAVDNFFPTLQRVRKENDPAVLTSYLLDVAKLFSKAYLVLRVVGEVDPNVSLQRLILFQRTKEVLEKGVVLLGMKPVQKM